MNVLDSFSLQGRVAVVTGSAGLFGRQLAAAVAEAGATTVLASRDQTKLKAQAGAMVASGLDAHAVEFDQSDERSVLAMRDHVIHHFGGIDVLVNNSVARPMKHWNDPAEAFAQSMSVNATGLFLVTRAVGDHMADRGRGSIVNIGSIQGVVGPDFTLYEELGWETPPDYFFHKGGLVQLTRFAAARLGPHGVRVNAVSPGGFYNNQDERFVKRYAARTFLGRLANESDLKGAVVFLASDASAYITGANLMIDGGYTSK